MLRIAAAGALLVVAGSAPAFATPLSQAVPAAAIAPTAAAVSPVGSAGVDLRLDSRTAGRLLAEGGAGSGDEKAKDDEKPGEKADEGPKLTVSKGPPAAPPKAPGSDDTFAFVKDWPFWAIVGGVVIVGASVYMINRNSNQERSCSSIYNGGCFGAK